MQNEPWFKKCVLYQIYPRSFKDSNNDGVGDLKGIIEKLDYLYGTDDSLGVNAIWISPIYASPMVDFGYDVSDYYSIHPIFGTMSDFDELVRLAHKRDLKIMMDYVPSHTSDQHEWFKQSKSSVNNPKRDWYIWADPASDGGPPNNWLSVFGGSAWEYDQKTKQYYLHTFLKEQPDLNWRNPKLKNEMMDVLRFWIEKGVDGFRTDAFPHIFKDPKLRNEPKNAKYKPNQSSWNQLKHIYTLELPDAAKLYDWFEEIFNEYPNRQLYMVTEDYTDIKGLKWHYKNSNPKHFAPLNLNMTGIKWNAKSIKTFIDKCEASLDDDDWPNYGFGNHDVDRVSQRYGIKNTRVVAMLLLTLRGMPILYYGDELGMQNCKIPADKVQDPFELRDPGKGTGRDPQRTPMQWDDSKFAGFSETEPWLPISKDCKSYNVKRLEKDKQSILSLYKLLSKTRTFSEALSMGKYAPNDLGNKNIFSFYRVRKNEKYLIILNFSGAKQKVKINEQALTIIVDTNMTRNGQIIKSGIFEVKGNAGYLMRLRTYDY